MTLREKINDIIDGTDSMHVVSGEEYRAARDTATDDILAAVRDAMLSEGAVAHYIDAVERAGVEDDPEPTYEESARLSAAFWLQAAGITETR